MLTAYMNWSGGKDSALCLYSAISTKQYHIAHLLTSVNAVHNRISMHGVRRELLEQQAASIGIPLQTIELAEEPGMAEYEHIMMGKVNELKSAGCTHALFGDIFLEDLKLFRQAQLRKAGIECVFPLWKMDTKELIRKFIALGFQSVLVCVNEKYLDKSFCGRLIDETFISDLPDTVDPCGENGEFHSFVFDGPLFRKPVHYTMGETVYRKYRSPENNDIGPSEKDPSQYGFYFRDLLPCY